MVGFHRRESRFAGQGAGGNISGSAGREQASEMVLAIKPTSFTSHLCIRLTLKSQVSRELQRKHSR